MKIRFRYVLLTLLILFVGFVVYRLTSGDIARPGVPLFAPNVAANYVIEPVDDNGDVDYGTILNERASQGILPENNLLAGMIEIVGDRFLEDSDRLSDAFYSRLGIDRPKPAATFWWMDWASENQEQTGDEESLKPFESLTERRIAIERFASLHPWSKEELPDFANYLSEISHQRDRVKKLLDSATGNYIPIAAMNASDTILGCFRSQDAIRYVGQLFRTACNGKLSEGDFDGALQEYRYLVLLANANANNPSTMDRIFAFAMRSFAIHHAWGIVRNQRCTADQLVRLEGILATLKEPSPFLNSLETERLVMLYAIQEEIRYGTGVIDMSAFGGAPMEGRRGRANAIYDAQIVMARINEFYDSMTSRLQGLDSLESVLALEEIESETALERPDRYLLEPNYYLAKMQGRNARSNALADAFIDLVVPSSTSAELEVVIPSKRKMLSLATAIELYQREQGSYPKSLDPDLLDLPRDAFVDPLNGGSFIYRLAESSYELYSAGFDGVDDNRQDENVYPLGTFDDVSFDDPQPMTWKAYVAEEAKALAEED